MNLTMIANQFALKRKIGSGTYGDVYIAKDIKNNVKVAIKMSNVKISFIKGFAF